VRIMRVFVFIRGIMPIILCGWIRARVLLARECSLLYVCVRVCVCGCLNWDVYIPAPLYTSTYAWVCTHVCLCILIRVYAW
jgi:hypothetical protein